MNRGSGVGERAVRRQHVGQVRGRLRTDGRTEHPKAFTGRDSEVELGEPILGVRADAATEGRGPWLEHADECAERRRGPLELAVDLVDERPPDESRNGDARADEHDADHQQRGDEPVSQ